MKTKKGQVDVFSFVFVVVFIVGVIILTLGFDKVEPNHLGVKVRLGEIVGTMNPGIQWTGILTSTKVYNMRIRQAKVDMLTEQSSATDKTGQIIFGSVSVNYRVKRDAEVVKGLWSNVGTDRDVAQVLNIIPIIKEGYKQATVQYEAMEILKNRQLVKELAIENIRNNFPNEYCEIVDIVVEDIDFTEDFKKAIGEKKRATQDKLKEEEQVQVVKFQQQQEIEVYKADAEKLRLQKSEITPMLIQKQMLEKWDGRLPQYLIMTPDSQGMLLNLAQGNIMQDEKGDLAQAQAEE